MDELIKTLLDEHGVWNDNPNIAERVSLALILLERATTEAAELRLAVRPSVAAADDSETTPTAAEHHR